MAAPKESLLFDETGRRGPGPAMRREEGVQGRQGVARGQRVPLRQPSQLTPVLLGQDHGRLPPPVDPGLLSRSGPIHTKNYRLPRPKRSCTGGLIQMRPGRGTTLFMASLKARSGA